MMYWVERTGAWQGAKRWELRSEVSTHGILHMRRHVILFAAPTDEHPRGVAILWARVSARPQWEEVPAEIETVEQAKDWLLAVIALEE